MRLQWKYMSGRIEPICQPLWDNLSAGMTNLTGALASDLLTHRHRGDNGKLNIQSS
jgi:hypothetical protein